MRLITLFVFLSSALLSCSSGKKTKSHFKSIEFSYFDISPLSFTLRIRNQDSVFLRQNFSPDKRLGNDTTYEILLTGRLKQQLDSLIDAINFSKLHPIYETGHIDGDEYELNIEADTEMRHFKVHSMSPPKELEAVKELFLKIRLSFLPVDTTTHLPLNLPEIQVQGNPRIFTLKDINSDKFYLADLVDKVFREGNIGRSPLVAIDGIVFKYQKNLDTVMVSLLKREIANIGFLNKKDGRFIYGKDADNGAIIINTTKSKSTSH